MDLKVRPAVLADQRQLSNLIHISPYVHRHLDWRSPLDWIESPPFYVLENEGQIVAALAAPPDPPQVGWIRLFVSSGKFPLRDSWQALWDTVFPELNSHGHLLIAAIILQEWFTGLLLSSGFATHQSIVMLERVGQPAIGMSLPAAVTIRTMTPADLAVVAEVDAAAFDPLWQNSEAALALAYPQAVFPTVAVAEGKVVGYQLSTRNSFGAHLARLAVLPALQGKGVGRALVADLIQHTSRHGMPRLTVNTQSDNSTSLALYNSIGFRETGERFPVYQAR